MGINPRILTYIVEKSEQLKIWVMAALLAGACFLLCYFHVILRIGTVVTHIFYIPIILAAVWWKRKGLVVALFSSGFLTFSHLFLRPDVAAANDYFRAFMFIVTAFVVSELSRRLAKEQKALQAANRQLRASEQHLRATNQQLEAANQQLGAANQQLRANEQQLVSEIAEREKAEKEIHDQHELLRNTIESLGHPFYVIDANDNTVKIANLAARQGKLPEKITCYMLSHKQNKPCDRSNCPCPLEEIKNTKQPVTVEHIHYDKDGNPRNIEVHAYPIFDNEQNVTQIIEYCMDITERKQAEEALRESENSYRAVVENAVEGIVVVQGQTLQFVNPGIVSMIGYSEKELLTRPFKEFIHPDHREWTMGIHIKRLKGEEVPPVYEFKVVDKKGNTKWLENNGILTEWRNRPATLNFLRDITERKKTQEALKCHIEFERLITMLSKRFIDPGDIDEKINQALKAIGEFAKVDRAYIFQLRDNNRTVDNTHEWCAEEIEPQIEYLKGITLDDELPWFWEKMKAHETFHVPVAADLPPEAHLEKKHFERQGIQALVVVPMLSKGILRGFLGFDSVRAQKIWAEDIITLLRISGENISLALDREHAEQRARLLSSIVEQSSEGMGVIDLQGNLLFLNNAFAVMHGYTPEELIGENLSIFHAPEQIPSVEAANRQVKETGKFDGEIWHVRRDGTVFPCLMHNSLLRDEAGNPIGLICALRDITKSKRAEQALKESEIKFRSLTEESLVGVYLIQDGIFKYINPKFAEIFGYSPDELIDKKGPDELVFPEDWPLAKENMRRKMAGEVKSIQYNFRGVTKDKKVIYAEVYGSATQYQGRPAVIGTLMDITERKRTQKALQDSELKFKTIFENAGGAIFIADNKTGEILECNSQAEQLLGRQRAEIIGMHQSELHPQDEEEKYKEKFAAHIQKGHIVDYEGEVQQRDGSRVPVWIAAQCLKIGGKDVIIGLFMDITERKQAEKKLLDHQAQLKSLASELSLTEERERHRLATELHDQIGQSLVISKIKLDLLRKSSASDELTKALEEICNYLGQVIADTRTLTFDLSSPILYELGFEAAVAEWLDEQIQQKHGIAIEFEDDEQPKPLDNNIRLLLFRNVRELLVNIVKHAQAHKVKVSVRRVDEHIHISVEDDGVGFDPVEVTSTAAQKAKFGLFSIRERLEQLGGFIEIESEPGHGSKIMMTAPLKHENISD